MLNFEFLITPIGLIVLATALLLAALHVLSVNRSLKDTKTTRNTLLEKAKLQAHQSFTVITSVSRKASTILPLLEHLESHKYDKLQVIVVIKPTAQKRTITQMRKFKKAHPGLNLLIIPPHKAITDGMVAQYSATGDYIIRMYAQQRLTPDFFAYSSYALVNEASALRLRYFVKPDTTLASGFYALFSLWRSLIEYITKRSIKGSTLRDGLILKRAIVAEGRAYKTQTVLYEDFAIQEPARQYRHEVQPSAVRAVIQLVLISLVTASLLFTSSVTPVQVFVFSVVLLIATYVVSSSLLLLGQKGLTFGNKVTLFFLIPFYPVWIVARIFSQSIMVLASKSIAAARLLSQKLKLAR